MVGGFTLLLDCMERYLKVLKIAESSMCTSIKRVNPQSYLLKLLRAFASHQNLSSLFGRCDSVLCSRPLSVWLGREDVLCMLVESTDLSVEDVFKPPLVSKSLIF